MTSHLRAFALSVVALWFACAQASAATATVTELKDVHALREWFQRSSGKVRVVALLSSSCKSCLDGFAGVQQALKEVTNPGISAAIVWMAIGPDDTNAAAVRMSSQFTDGRLAYFWDPYRAAGETWQPVLKLNGSAWDVYLVYSPSASWNEPDLDPGVPAFWMHQLKEVPQAPAFEQHAFQQKIISLLPR